MTMSQTLITSRDPKGLHAIGLFEAVYNKSKLDEARAQRLNERGGELQDGIAKLIAELSVSNQYADEEVRSSYTYPKEYKGPKPIADQIKAIAKIFDLDPSQAIEFAKNLPALPRRCRGMVRHSVGRRTGQEALPRSDRSCSEVLPGGPARSRQDRGLPVVLQLPRGTDHAGAVASSRSHGARAGSHRRDTEGRHPDRRRPARHAPSWQVRPSGS